MRHLIAAALCAAGLALAPVTALAQRQTTTATQDTACANPTAPCIRAPVLATAPSPGAGTVDWGSLDPNGNLRVVLPALPALPAGSNAIGTVGVTALPALPTGSNAIGAVTLSQTVTNPTSTLTEPSTTTAYGTNTLIASSATAGSVVVPSFAIATSAGGAVISRLRLSSNDATSTAWPAASLQVDLWSSAPTFTNGDRGAWSIATGTASHLGAFSCTMSAEYGDGAYAECSPAVGSFATPKLASGTAVYWTLKAISGSGVTGASKVWTITPELLN